MSIINYFKPIFSPEPSDKEIFQRNRAKLEQLKKHELLTSPETNQFDLLINLISNGTRLLVFAGILSVIATPKESEITPEAVEELISTNPEFRAELIQQIQNNSDLDQDGLTALTETLIGTNPNIADSDNDGNQDSVNYIDLPIAP